jgi:hypothetical protein
MRHLLGHSKTTLLIAAFVLSARAPASAGDAIELPTLDLVFVQPDMDFLDREAMAADLDRAVRGGVREVIVQYLAHGGSRLPPVDPTHPDPVLGFLDLAQERDLRVWLGSWEFKELWRRDVVPLAVWRRVADLGASLIEEVAERYHHHPAFAGWYWTPEAVWATPPSEARLEALSWTTREALLRIRAVSPDAPVTIVLGPGYGEGNLLTRSWCRYIEAAEAERVVVMDSVGMGHLDAALAGALYQQVATCTERGGGTVVANIEFFGPLELGFAPSVERMRIQYAAARENTTIVGAFDLNHHLRPGTVGEAFWTRPQPILRRIELTHPKANPDENWRARPRLDYGLFRSMFVQGVQSVTRLELVTKEDHPEYVEAAIVDSNGESTDLGPATPRHGPGHDEVTWIRHGAVPVEASGVEFRMSTKKGTMRPVELRAYR